jgi:hypothetical protein
VHLTDVAEIVFAVAAVVAGVGLAVTVAGRASRNLLLGLALALGAAAVSLWVCYALEQDTPIAVSAAGTTLAAIMMLAAMRLRRLVQHARRVDSELASAEQRLENVIQREAAERAAELERTLARARADSASLLAEQERRIAEERRRAAAEQEREANASLAEALTRAQQHIETRLRSWTEDLDRAQRAVGDQLEQLKQRQRQLIVDAETRIAADIERLESEGEQQRSGLVRLRDELARAIQETVSEGSAELEAHAAERRRALHELNDRIRRRERSLAEQIEREETDATRRIETTFAEVERRQVEQLQRVLDRAATSFSEAATQQFGDAIRSAREDAATRLSRELERAVQAFTREAEKVLAEQLGHVGDAGTQRLEKRLSMVTSGLDRQRAEAIAAFEQRLLSEEQELRRRIETLAADAEAERAVIEARLHDLAQRIESATARA